MLISGSWGLGILLSFNCTNIFVAMIPMIPSIQVKNADETLFTLSRQYVLDPFATHVGIVGVSRGKLPKIDK